MVNTIENAEAFDNTISGSSSVDATSRRKIIHTLNLLVTSTGKSKNWLAQLH